MWFKNPKFLKAKKDFIDQVSPWQLSSLHYFLPKIIFICGGDEKYHKNRGLLEEYFIKHHPKWLTFRAEDAWDVISQDDTSNALVLEEWLADFSDVVIIIVESFGTVGELGAFSLSPTLRKKLLPILDIKYKKELSFINTGPIKWIDKDSKFQPSIYTKFDSILTCVPEIEERINKRSWDFRLIQIKYGNYHFSNKVLLFFLVYIVSALGPITVKEIVSITNSLIGYKEKNIIDFVLSIGVALHIFSTIKLENSEYFSCTNHEKFKDYSTNLFLNRIQASRAKCFSLLYSISDYRDVLRKVVKIAS